MFLNIYFSLVAILLNSMAGTLVYFSKHNSEVVVLLWSTLNKQVLVSECVIAFLCLPLAYVFVFFFLLACDCLDALSAYIFFEYYSYLSRQLTC